MNRIVKINPMNPEEILIGKAVRTLKNSGVIAYPTETVYGIGCNIFDIKSVNRIFELKNRDRSKAMILIAADIIQISGLVKEIPETAEVLAETFWPGPLTMVFNISPDLENFAFRKSRTVAIRIPDSIICNALLKSSGFPIVSTSANKSGAPDSTTAEQVYKYFGNELDLIIDGGQTPGQIPSTVVDVTKSPVKIVRAGVISDLEINTVLETV